MGHLIDIAVPGDIGLRVAIYEGDRKDPKVPRPRELRKIWYGEG